MDTNEVSIINSPTFKSDSGTYHTIINLIVFDAPGNNVNGTYKEVPGASFSTGSEVF
jgi:hypothetical protein